ncbi:amino acid ABC transporter substrate-binding protein [Acidovorax sp. A1169]|uniref:amino acid ABC transporter substrate-binding protein n=1 Tax=Acidovorax sp. A1169 TaxID=3059524 RepID=UPI0027379848|nr:amino acid ABC transporter substrate-binding protein [Acidovorax sp. A1169]MDP4073325.1 amino acid ABC transporter substrate-binding protein [Acidovorax sp. A1169]
MRLSAVTRAALLATGLLACSIASADTLKKIADTGKITLAYRESSVPFSYLAGPGQPVGFAVDISNAVADAVKKRLNNPAIKVELQPVTSLNRIPLVQNGTVDLECGSTTNNSVRGKDVQFATNYFYTGTRLLTKKSSGIKGFGDLAKRKISTTSGTTNAQVVRKYDRDNKLDMEVLMGKDHEDSLLLVDTGRSEAFAMDDILLYGLMANARNPAEWDVVGDALQVEPYACMLRKDDPQFQTLVNGVIGGLMKSGEFEKLYTKWFMSPIAPRGQNLKLPMGKELRDNLTTQSDKPAI